MIRRKMNLTGRVLITVLVLVFAAVSASAYTVVMRDGRRIEIPNNFTVTESTLTYGVSKGIQVTLQLSTVDVAATERANGEASGSFLRRINPLLATAPQVQTANARRSITNADLEQYRRARIDNEMRRQELGLPSVKERQNEVAAIDDRTLEHVRNVREQQEKEQEAYWRARSELLRTQGEANGPQMNYDPRFVNGGWGDPFGTFFPVNGFGVDGGFGRFGRFNRLPVSLFPGFLSTPITPFPSLRPMRRPLLFSTPGTRVIVRPSHRRNH
jgi:hypothetical protein